MANLFNKLKRYGKVSIWFAKSIETFLFRTNINQPKRLKKNFNMNTNIFKNGAEAIQVNRENWHLKKFPAITTVQNQVSYKLKQDPVWCLDTANIHVVYEDKVLNWNQILFWICKCELENPDGNTHLEGHIRMRYFPKESHKMHEKIVPCKIKEQGNRLVLISWYELCVYLDRIFLEIKSFVDDYRKDF